MNDLDKECKQCGLDGGTHCFDCPLGHTKCMHLYKYSHQESIPVSSTGCNEILIDVVVCEMCGDTKRNNK